MKKKKKALSNTRLRLCVISSLCFLCLLLFFWAFPHSEPEPAPKPPPELKVKLEVFAEPGNPRVTFWSSPTAFPNTAQTIAMLTWLRLNPQPEIIYYTDAPGVPEMVEQVGIRHVTNISKNSFGNPLMSDLFDRVQEEARGDIIVYLNPSLIVTQKFMDILLRLAEHTSNTTFLLTGPRVDVVLNDRFFLFDYTWFKDFDTEYNKEERKTSDAFLDYFAFTKGLFSPGNVPAFSKGRSWETWMLSSVLHGPHPTINGEAVMQAYHLPGEAIPVNKTAEELQNTNVLELSGGSKGGTLYCTDYLLGTCDEKLCLKPNTAALKNEYCQHSNTEKIPDSILSQFNG